MASSTVVTIIQSGVTALTDYFSLLLPVILPVAVGIAILFGIWFWIRGSARRHY